MTIHLYRHLLTQVHLITLSLATLSDYHCDYLSFSRHCNYDLLLPPHYQFLHHDARHITYQWTASFSLAFLDGTPTISAHNRYSLPSIRVGFVSESFQLFIYLVHFLFPYFRVAVGSFETFFLFRF